MKQYRRQPNFVMNSGNKYNVKRVTVNLTDKDMGANRKDILRDKLQRMFPGYYIRVDNFWIGVGNWQAFIQKNCFAPYFSDLDSKRIFEYINGISNEPFSFKYPVHIKFRNLKCR